MAGNLDDVDGFAAECDRLTFFENQIAMRVGGFSFLRKRFIRRKHQIPVRRGGPTRVPYFSWKYAELAK